MFDNLYVDLKNGFQNKWYRFLLQNTRLGTLLAQDNPPSPWDFFSLYLSSWRLTRWLVRLCIQTAENLDKFDVELVLIQNLIQRLKEKELFLVAVAKDSNFKSLTYAVNALAHHGLLTQKNLNTVAHHSDPGRMASVLYLFNESHNYTPEELDKVAKHSNLGMLIYALNALAKNGFLTPDNLDKVAKHSYPDRLADAFFALHRAGIYTSENREAVAHHSNPEDLAAALSNLKRNNINFNMKRHSIILETHDEYLRAKNIVDESIQGMLIPRSYNVVREKYFNLIQACLSEDTFKSLPTEIIAHILEFVKDPAIHRKEAMEVFQSIQLPEDDNLDIYINSLKNKLQEYTNRREQNLLLSFNKSSFWSNRNTNAQAQHEFDKQYGLVIKP